MKKEMEINMENKESTNVDKVFEVKDVSVNYGDFTAIENVNMEIFKNKITAFIGPSGCGKSTLIRSFNRMNDLIQGAKVFGTINYLKQGTRIIGNLMKIIF